jgi:hypothetical protein
VAGLAEVAVGAAELGEAAAEEAFGEGLEAAAD